MVKNWCSILGHGTLQYAQRWIDEIGWFCACWYRFRKAKGYFNKYWVGMVKSERDVLDHGTLRSGVLHK